jgi:hypothetical protein
MWYSYREVELKGKAVDSRPDASGTDGFHFEIL